MWKDVRRVASPGRGIAEKVLPLPRGQVWELLSNTEHLNSDHWPAKCRL